MIRERGLFLEGSWRHIRDPLAHGVHALVDVRGGNRYALHVCTGCPTKMDAADAISMSEY